MSDHLDPSRRRATIFQHKVPAGELAEANDGKWVFAYFAGYSGASVSLTMPVRVAPYPFNFFPPPFEGLLPEGAQLEALLRKHKIDRDDAFGQLVAVGGDLVGSLTVVERTVGDE